MSRNHRAGKYLISGFPRATDHSDAWEATTEFPSSMLYLETDNRNESFNVQTMPVVEKYAGRGLCRIVSARGTENDVYERIRVHYSPTIVLVANAESSDVPMAMVNLSRAATCARIDVTKLVASERTSDTSDGALIRLADSTQGQVPMDVLLRLLKDTVGRAPSQRILLEGFPRLVSAGDSVVSQLDALERVMGPVVHMLYVEDTAKGETSSFRLETSPVVRFMEKRGCLTRVNVAEDGFTPEKLAIAVSKLNEQFDPEARSRAEGMMLAELTAKEQERIEQARIDAENDLGGGEDGEDGEEEDE